MNTTEDKYMQIMVKRHIWSRLAQVAATLQLQRGRNVGRGEVIEEMLAVMYPQAQAQPEPTEQRQK